MDCLMMHEGGFYGGDVWTESVLWREEWMNGGMDGWMHEWLGEGFYRMDR